MVENHTRYQPEEIRNLGSETGFMAKLALALRILPHVEGTEHEQLIIDCFQKPQNAPYRGKVSEDGPPIREFPTSSEELIRELSGRRMDLEHTISQMEKKKKREMSRREEKKRSVEKELLDQAIEAMPEQEKVRIRHRLKQLNRLKYAYDPQRLPEVKDKLAQTTRALEFIEELVEDDNL